VRTFLIGASLCLITAVGPARAQISIIGEWTGRYHEDQGDRVPGDVQGDFTGVPINDAARKYAEAFDVTRVAMLEHQCQPYNVAHIYRGPNQCRVWEEKDPATQEIVAYRIYNGTYQQYRTIWMDGRAHPPEYVPHTHMGFSTGEWHGDILTVDDAHRRVLSPQRPPEQRPDDARRALDPPWQRAVARFDHHRSRVSDGAVHHERRVRAHGARQSELALQLRVRHGSPDGQERRAVLLAGPESVH
jgi:hypothetical protein